MRYFTDELWNDINSGIKKVREEAILQWERNNKEYYEIFQNVKNVLPKKFLKIYMREHGFHDYQLKNFEIIHSEKVYNDPVDVSIIITDNVDSWNIVYKKIKKIAIKYEQQPDVFERKRKIEYRGFDTYGYDEFYQIDEKVLSHEILFASGATILVHFEKISINKVQINKDDIKLKS